MKFYDDNEDCAWLLDTALREYEVPVFRSFTLEGHEDCPLKIELYESQSPLITDTPVATFTLVTGQDNLGVYERK